MKIRFNNFKIGDAFPSPLNYSVLSLPSRQHCGLSIIKYSDHVYDLRCSVHDLHLEIQSELESKHFE